MNRFELASQIRNLPITRRALFGVETFSERHLHRAWRAKVDNSVPRENLAPLFAIDGHSSVIADLRSLPGMPPIRYWNVSGSDNPSVPSQVVRHIVQGLGPHAWDRAGWSEFREFRSTYQEQLHGHSGFIAAHPSSFASLYHGLERPVLINISTRYEHPFTLKGGDWSLLDRSLLEMFQQGWLHPVANNVGDQEYFTAQTGIPCEYAPSLCNYVGQPSNGKKAGRAIFSSNPMLIRYIESETHGRWLDRRKLLQHHYSWREISQLEGAFIVPYNSSTMTVFELASLGVPMFVPTLRLLKTLESRFGYGVMDDVSFARRRGRHIPRARMNYLSGQSLTEWWYERSDFLRSPLVSEFVTFVDDFDQLVSAVPTAPSEIRIANAESKVRNMREQAYASFLSSVKRGE